jgi:hypothetical protein
VPAPVSGLQPYINANARPLPQLAFYLAGVLHASDLARDDVGGFDEDKVPVEDLDMWLRIAGGSRTPVLWRNGHFLVDLRLRPGSITRDRSAAYNAIHRLLREQTARLRHSPPGLAYVHPAVAALKYGDAGEDLAEELAAVARSAGTCRLLRSFTGWRLIFWHTLPRSQRRMVRAAQRNTSEAIKSANRRLRGSPGSNLAQNPVNSEK